MGADLAQGLIFNGAVSIAVNAVGVVMLMGWIPPVTSLIALLAVLAPYVTLLAFRAEYLRERLPSNRVSRFFCNALAQAHEHARKDKRSRRALWTDAMSLVPALISIILGSYGMVHTAVLLGHRWGIPQRDIGMLVLAALTGVPNVLASIRLAIKGRGSAVISEALDSNSLNVLAGVCLPAVLLGLGPISGLTDTAAWWMLAMTTLIVALTLWRRGLTRWEAAGVIAIYAAFVLVVVLW